MGSDPLWKTEFKREEESYFILKTDIFKTQQLVNTNMGPHCCLHGGEYLNETITF